jgi:hypothetical protein
MRYSNFVLLALATLVASTDLLAAQPTRKRSMLTTETKDLILLPDGEVLSKRDPDWKSATAEAG